MGSLAGIRAMWAIAWTDVRLLLRDRAAAFFTFVFPIIFAIFFGLVFGGDAKKGKIEIAVAQLDQGSLATEFVSSLKQMDGFNVTSVASEADGEKAVREGKASACIIIPGGFEKGLDSIFANGKGPEVPVLVDPSKAADTGLLQGRLMEQSFAMMAKSITQPERMKKQLQQARDMIAKSKDIDLSRKLMFGTLFQNIETFTNDANKPGEDGKPAFSDNALSGFSPMQFEMKDIRKQRIGPTNAYEVSLPQGIVWGLMGCVTAFVSTLARDRQRGTLVRLRSAPVSRWQIVGGKAMAGFVSCMLVQWLLIGIFAMFFGVRVPNPPMLIVATVFSACAFVGVMMFLAVIGRSGEGSAGFGRSVILIMALIGGGTLPVFFMPAFMKPVSMASPFKWSVDAIEGATWRGYDSQQMFLPLAVLAGVAIGGFVLGSMMFRRAMRE
ncbi:MAG: ABC transporter permease [Planctomycetes bacterium]|nr:ABC transporter permease [Planctomycetota bacterium]